MGAPTHVVGKPGWIGYSRANSRVTADGRASGVCLTDAAAICGEGGIMPFSLFPGWASIHPMVVHFPIVLLLIAPLFIVIATVLKPPKGRPYMIAALILQGLGTAALLVAIPTGHVAARIVSENSHIRELLQVHENLAFEARGIFLMLFLLYVWVLVAPRLTHRGDRLFSTVIPLWFLLLYCAGVVVLIHTAHDGGRLVHEFGVHATTPGSSNAWHASAGPEH